MDDFKNLVNDWKNIREHCDPGTVPEEGLIEKLTKIQRRTVFQNLMMSIAFALTFLVLGWVHTHVSDQTPAFYNSIKALFVLLIVTMLLNWQRVLFWRKPDYSADTRTFSARVIRKLKFNLWMSRIYMIVYLVVLALMISFYMMEVLRGASMLLTIGAFAVTYAWIFGMGAYMQRKQARKQEKELLPLIEQLTEMSREWESGAS